MNEVPVSIHARGIDVATGPTACRTPSLNLYLFADGDVGPCCRNRAYGNLAGVGLDDMWNGERRHRIEAQLARGVFPAGCELCEVEHRLEGREGSFSSTFDHHGDLVDGPAENPVRMEFELSNSCNLQCVQCNGELSSAIRSRREHRAPLRRSYDEAFFEELRRFIPTLRTASFVGGEPFLSPECFRVWEMIAELAPELQCTVTTNGTLWNERVERVMSTLRMQPFVSVDGITSETFASIRVGADLDLVLANLERFRDVAASHSLTASMVFCVMPENILELPDLLLHAEALDVDVTTSVVREPADRSVGHLPSTDLVEILDEFERRDEVLAASLVRNAAAWRTELARVRSWVAQGRKDRLSWTEQSPRILMFLRQGRGPVDEEKERSTLALDAVDGSVRTAEVGADHSIRRCTPAFAELFGVHRDLLEGEPISRLQASISKYEGVEETADRYEARLALGAGTARMVMLPRRGDDGWADEIVLLVVPVSPNGP